MPCYHPLTAYQRKKGDKPYFGDQELPSHFKLSLKCGQCIGCRLDKSRDWAIRCIHEASLYDRNCFITLTYDDSQLPRDQSLNKRHFTLFMKRLRKKFGSGIRFFMCGEYGDKTSRPHYHACLFNFDFDDKVLWKTKGANDLYLSESLMKLWPFGFSTIGDVTFESAAYVARYITKKVTGDLKERINEFGLKYYEKIDFETGQIHAVTPEYTQMSRRPGIAAQWFQRWKDDVYPDDTVIYKGREIPPPKFYDRLFGEENPEELERIKENRRDAIRKFAADLTQERLAVREKVKLSQFQLLTREIEK